MHITRAFLDGIKETAAQEIHPINVTDRHIEFCRGRFACKYNGGHCVLEVSNVLSQEQFEQDGGTGEVASCCNTVTVRSVHPNTTVAFRVNNLRQRLRPDALRLRRRRQASAGFRRAVEDHERLPGRYLHSPHGVLISMVLPPRLS